MTKNLMMILLAAALSVPGMAGAKPATNTPPEVPPAGHKLDWYNLAEVSARPYLTKVYNLCDGDLATGSYYEGGPEVGGTLAFAFPSAIEVTAFRFVQGGTGASKFRLNADTDGSGKFEIEIKTEETPKIVVGKWIVIPVNKKVRGLEFMALAGTAGYRAAFPQFQEVEIYTKDAVNVPAAARVAAKQMLSAGPAVAFPATKVRAIENIVCTDYWHAGLLQNGSNLPPDLNAFKPFRTMIEQLKAVDATAVRVFSECACGDNRLAWPTDFGPHTEKNVLKTYVDALHKEGLRTYYFTHAWITPFQKADKMAPMPDKRWDYPYEQSDRLIYLKDSKYTEKYPCIICENDFHDKWLRLLSEALAQGGMDGVYLMPDEYYFKGHNLPKTDCPACRREFKKRFGYEALPPKPADTEQYRKWELFEYDKINDLYSDVARQLKKTKPDLKIVSNGNQAMVQLYNTRMEHGMALDIQGRDPSVDAGSAYGNVTLDFGGYTALSRRYNAAFGDGHFEAPLQWLNISCNEKHDPIKLYGYLLPYIMEGARSVSNYRLNYMADDPQWWATAIDGFKRLRLLEQWGIGQSRTPASVCVLLSRASEDWWEVKMEGLLGENAADTSRSTVLFSQDETLGAIVKADTDTRTRELNYERFHGMASDKCVEGLLVEAGIPYAVRYSERPETLANLKSYKLIILPFSYSVSKETFAAVKAATEAGTKVLIVEQLAPTDEFGTPYPVPLLAELQGTPNVTFEKINLAREGMKRPVRARMTELVQKLTGDTGIRFNANGGRVEFLVREVTDGSRIVYLANWGYQPATPVIGLDLPQGQYGVTLCGGDGVALKQGLLDGRSAADAAAFKSFAVTLAPREVVLMDVVPQKAEKR